MCLIIEQLPGNVLSYDLIRRVYGNNSDGFGVMWTDPQTGIVHTENHLPQSVTEAWEAYVPHAGRHCVFHWRMATHGAVTIGNTHPFRVANGAVMHNGVLAGFGSADRSDTGAFCHDVLAHLPDLDVESVQATIQAVAGHGVIVTATPQGYTWSIAKPRHIDDDGNWYSNTYAMAEPWRGVYTGGAGRWGLDVDDVGDDIESFLTDRTVTVTPDGVVLDAADELLLERWHPALFKAYCNNTATADEIDEFFDELDALGLDTDDDVAGEAKSE